MRSIERGRRRRRGASSKRTIGRRADVDLCRATLESSAARSTRGKSYSVISGIAWPCFQTTRIEKAADISERTYGLFLAPSCSFLLLPVESFKQTRVTRERRRVISGRAVVMRVYRPREASSSSRGIETLP